jgi:hypothetical protein
MCPPIEQEPRLTSLLLLAFLFRVEVALPCSIVNHLRNFLLRCRKLRLAPRPPDDGFLQLKLTNGAQIFKSALRSNYLDRSKAMTNQNERNFEQQPKSTDTADQPKKNPNQQSGQYPPNPQDSSKKDPSQVDDSRQRDGEDSEREKRRAS